MMKRLIFMSATALFAALAAYGQSGTKSGTLSPYSQYGMGILADGTQAFGRGMAGTGIGMRNGTVINTLNPASYSAVDSLTMLFDAGVTGNISSMSEGGTRAVTRTASFDYATGLFRMRRNLGVSFGIMPFSDVGYSYNNAVSLGGVMGSVYENYSGSGGVHQAFVGAGWRPLKPLSVGVNLGYLWGTYTRSVSTTATTTVNSLSKTYGVTISDYNLSLGLQWQQPLGRKDVLTVGATMGLGHKLGCDPTCDIVNTNTATLVSDTTTFTIKNGIELPMTIGAGLSLQHGKSLTVAADWQMQRWGSVGYPAYDETLAEYHVDKNLLKDRTRLSIGADYVADPTHPSSYLKHVHVRLGAAYATPYYKVNGNDGPSELTISAGLGLPLLNKWENRSVVNISAQWVRTNAKDLITDNTFRITLGLTFNERWFAKWRVE